MERDSSYFFYDHSWMEHDNHHHRQQIKNTALQHLLLFTPRYNTLLKDQRELAYCRLKLLCDQQCISVEDFHRNPQNIFSIHEVVATIDPSLATKLTVQFNLFGGTLYRLGSEEHRSLIPFIDNFTQVGCFALTELGYGNNAVEMETTAHYDCIADEFIINSPTIKSQKYWITNGAIHAHWAIVFAQLYVDQKLEGVHPFLVRIRDDNLKICKGVIIEDMGHKLGCNGVDNAKLAFNNVHIPRTSLLNKISSISKDGKVISKVKGIRDRFLVASDQLLSGRLCIASMMMGCTKVAITIGVKYASSRLGVGYSGKSDTPIISYQLQLDAFVPLVAKTYVLNSALSKIKEYFSQLHTKPGPIPSPGLEFQVMVLCCALKPALAWHAEEVVTACRERSGGQGYLSCNQFGELLGFAHAGITAEGDNRVLWTKVSKELLNSEKVSQTGLLKSLLDDHDKQLLTRMTNLDMEKNDIHKILEFLYDRLLIKISDLRSNMNLINRSDREATFEFWMKENFDYVQSVARAFVEWKFLDFHLKEVCTLVDGLPKLMQSRLGIPLTQMARLFGLEGIKADFPWILGNESRIKTCLPKNLINGINQELRCIVWYLGGSRGEELQTLVACFGLEEKLVFAPIAKDWEKYNDMVVPKLGELLNVQEN